MIHFGEVFENLKHGVKQYYRYTRQILAGKFK